MKNKKVRNIIYWIMVAIAVIIIIFSIYITIKGQILAIYFIIISYAIYRIANDNIKNNIKYKK